MKRKPSSTSTIPFCHANPGAPALRGLSHSFPLGYRQELDKTLAVESPRRHHLQNILNLNAL
jgi:hypothetical protein